MLNGYAGKILRVNLTNKRVTEEPLGPEVAETWVGGTGLGAKILYDEVPPVVSYDSPENKVVMASGPLGGTSVFGSGTFTAVTKGALTGGAATSQANGFFGAYLKFCGYDALIIEGQSSDWVYIYVSDAGAEIRSAEHLLGLDTWETEDRLTEELGTKQLSVFGIGPAGEHQVRFAALVGEHGHVAAHNGIGAVLGSKRLKAIAVVRGKNRFSVYDEEALRAAAREMADAAKEVGFGVFVHKWGTPAAFPMFHGSGGLPVKNLTTNVFPQYEQFSGESIRSHFENKQTTCWACGWGHCRYVKITEGPFAGFEGEEPEYEGLAGMGSVIGVTDPAAAIVLCNYVDRLGMDVNESGWVIGWVIECYEKGLLTSSDLDGVEPVWGDVESAKTLLTKIANRDGCGAWLAEGVKRSAERLGGAALECGVYTLKGNTPRGHDHRAIWTELLDTCTSSTGTIEVTGGSIRAQQHGLDPITDPFSWEQVARQNGVTSGRRLFEDSLGICRFPAEDIALIVKCVNLSTGWDLDVNAAMKIGKRIANLLRAYNFRCGITADVDFPSPRYGSRPVDGPAAGVDPGRIWLDMRSAYYKWMGWDPRTGRPLPETLEDLGLGTVVRDLYHGGCC